MAMTNCLRVNHVICLLFSHLITCFSINLTIGITLIVVKFSLVIEQVWTMNQIVGALIGVQVSLTIEKDRSHRTMILSGMDIKVI